MMKNNVHFYKSNNSYKDRAKIELFVKQLFLFLIIFISSLAFLFNFKVLDYFDEFFSLVFFPLIVFRIAKKRTNLLYVLLLLVLIFIFGYLGNLFCGIQTNIVLCVLDFFLMFKWVFFSVELYIIFSNKKVCSIGFKRALLIYFGFLILLMFFVNNYQYFVLHYPKPVFFSSFNGDSGFFSFGVFIFLYYCYKNKVFLLTKSLVFLMIISFYNCLLSMSSLSITLIILFLLYSLLKDVFHFNTSSIFIVILIGSLCLGLVYREKIFSYFFNPNTPRGALLLTSFFLLATYFPFGCGYSLYGTAIAVKYYSPIYFSTGIYTIDGCGPSNPTYLMDSYVSGVIGELGFIGVLLFLLLIYFVFKETTFFLKKDRYLFFCFLYFLGSILLFNTVNSIQFFALFPIFLLCFSEKKKGDHYVKRYN